MPKSNLSVLQRFERLYVPEPNSGCWLWTGHINAKGYAKFGGLLAHRFSYEAHLSKPIANEIDHKCNVRSCVNPLHLDDVSHQENVVRSFQRGRKRRRISHGDETHCPQGHPYSGDNLYLYPGPNQHRGCRTCMKVHRARAAAKKAAIAGEVR